jgi:hypothetical protein
MKYKERDFKCGEADYTCHKCGKHITTSAIHRCEKEDKPKLPSQVDCPKPENLNKSRCGSWGDGVCSLTNRECPTYLVTSHNNKE